MSSHGKTEKKQKELKERPRDRSLDVPPEVYDQLCRNLDKLTLEKKYRQEKQEEKRKQFGVKRILNHQMSGNNFSFLVQFNDGSEEWVEDRHCNCETYIRAYLAVAAPRVRTVYVVCRVSSKGQAQYFNVSLEDQQACVLRYAESLEIKHGDLMRYKVVKIQGSAYKQVPPEIQEIADVSIDGDIVMIYRVDRLSRNIMLSMAPIETMNARGVRIYSVDEDLWYHRAKLDFLQAVLDAHKVAAGISKKVRSSVSFRRARGDYVGGTAYGYRIGRSARDKGKLVEHPEEQKIIKEIISLVKKEADMSGPKYFHFAKVANSLNSRGLFKRGKEWNHAMVRRIYESRIE